MKENTFRTMILDPLCSYYERKHPTQASVSIWFERAQRIPDEAAPWITSAIQNRSEVFPKNLPNMLWALWNEWLEAHPDRKAREDGGSCREPLCDYGFLHAVKQDEAGHWILYAFRCSLCKRKESYQSYPWATMPMLLASGYTADTHEATMERMPKPVTRRPPKRDIDYQGVVEQIKTGKLKFEERKQADDTGWLLRREA